MKQQMKGFDKTVGKMKLELRNLVKFQANIANQPEQSEHESWVRLKVQASSVTDLYNGLEKLMEVFADHSESNISKSEYSPLSWHKSLLNDVFDAIPDWDHKTYSILDEIRKFRHLCRHRFTSDLEWGF